MSLSMLIWRKKVQKIGFLECYAVALHFLQLTICDYLFYLNNVKQNRYSTVLKNY